MTDSCGRAATTLRIPLLGAFAPSLLLAVAWAHAEKAGYLGHPCGDLCLIEVAEEPRRFKPPWVERPPGRWAWVDFREVKA